MYMLQVYYEGVEGGQIFDRLRQRPTLVPSNTGEFQGFKGVTNTKLSMIRF